MSVIISDDILRLANLSEAEFKLEVAIFFYQKQLFTIGQSSDFANMHSYEFQKILGERKIPVHYDQDDLAADLNTLKKL